MNILHDLCDLLCVEPDVLLKFSATAPHRYKVYTIPKRNGKGKRTIAHPSKELKYVQRSLLELLNQFLPVHDAAMAYRKGIGIKDNAGMHSRSSYLLKMDFNNFFPSVTPDLFFKVLASRRIEFNYEDIQLMRGILFWKPIRKGGLVLSIGAPTSPLISNSLMYGFDESIYKSCEGLNVQYTRYADDLIFSTNKKGILFEIPKLVEKVLVEELHGEIIVNSEKTVFSSKAHNRHVTGITISNDSKLSIGRERKRNISAAVHSFKLGKLTKEEVSSLQGKIAFARHVEPAFYARLERKYGEDVLSNLMTYESR